MIYSRDDWVQFLSPVHDLLRPLNSMIAALLLLGTGHSAALAQSEGVACTYNGYIGSFDFPIEGEITTVFTEGTTAYVSFYSDAFVGVSVLDVSDPLNVRGLGSVPIEDPENLLIDNALAYVGHDNLMLDIYNLSGPQDIELVGTTLLSFKALGFELDGNLLYTHNRSRGLSIVDVSDPSNPDEIGTYASAGSIRDIAVFGESLFLLSPGNPLEIVDVGDPTNPVQIGLYNTAAVALWKIKIDGSRAFLVGSGFIEVVDVSVPDSPTQVSLVSIDGLLDGFVFESLADIRLVGDVLSLLYEEGGLFVIDFSDSIKPKLIGQIDTRGYGSRFDIEDGIAYIAELTHGLSFIDLNTLNALSSRVATTIPPGLDSRRVTVKDDIAYVTDLREGLTIYDVSDPANPVSLSRYNVQSEILIATQISDGVAYLAAEESGLHILDVSDPANPELILVYNPLGDVFDVVVDGDLACIMTLNEVFLFLDIADPTSPTLEGVLSFDFHVVHQSMALKENMLYLSSADNNNAKLIAVDLSDPIFPVIDMEEIDNPLGRIAIDGDYLYGIDVYSEFGLTIFDRQGLRIDGRFSMVGSAKSVSVSEGRAYVGDFKQLVVFNVEESSNPFIIGTVETRSKILDISVDGSIAYLANDEFGLDIIDVSENCSSCAADFNGDGSLDFLDVSAFLELFSASDPRSDLTGDGRFDFFDVSAFLTAFHAGCP